MFDKPAVAAIDARGGGPGTREGALLDLSNTVQRIDAIALAGGSAFGLEAGGGVQAWLAEQGRGFAVRGAIIPIVPGAIMFDLLNGGNKAWGRFAPYRDLGYTAAAAASTNFAQGSVGAGLGATTANFKGGIGSASALTQSGVQVAALAVVNAVGSVTVGDGPWFWAAPFEIDGEYGGNPRPPYSPSISNGAAQNHGPSPTVTLPTALTTASAATWTPLCVSADAEPIPPLKFAVVAPRPAPTLPCAKLVLAAAAAV